MARSDMFFKATGKKTGQIVGESNDKYFPNQIDVVDWSWGMTAPSAVGGSVRSGRTLLGELKLVKRADKASTALMSVMKQNEILTTAILTVRKAAGPPSALPYYLVSLKDARIVAFEVRSDRNDEGAPILTEHLSLTFISMQIDYAVQSETGGSSGSSSVTLESTPP